MMPTSTTRVQTTLPNQIVPAKRRPIHIKRIQEHLHLPVADTQGVQGLDENFVLGATGMHWEINNLVTGAQQTQIFLQEIYRQLQSLKRGLADLISNARQKDGEHIFPLGIKEEIDQEIAGLNIYWANRYQATGGMLDAQLRFLTEDRPRRGFFIEKFDNSLLHFPETFVFHSLSMKMTQSISLHEGLSQATVVMYLNQTLSPFGIRAQWQKDQLLFSVSEDQWPATRDHLMIKVGKGPLSRVNMIAVNSKVEPASWTTNSTEELRQTLHQVIRAEQDVESVLAVVQSTLGQIGARLTPILDSRHQVVELERFTSLLEQSGQGYSKIALWTRVLFKATRRRILALLSLS